MSECLFNVKASKKNYDKRTMKYFLYNYCVEIYSSYFCYSHNTLIIQNKLLMIWRQKDWFFMWFGFFQTTLTYLGPLSYKSELHDTYVSGIVTNFRSQCLSRISRIHYFISSWLSWRFFGEWSTDFSHFHVPCPTLFYRNSSHVESWFACEKVNVHNI